MLVATVDSLFLVVVAVAVVVEQNDERDRRAQ